MTYSVWMYGKPIGHTKLEYTHDARKRAGMFRPTEFGLSVLPGITAMCPALVDFSELCRREGIDVDDSTPETALAAFNAFTGTPQGQRVLAAAKQIAEIEVLDPAGRPVSWESLAISDVEELNGLAGRQVPEATADAAREVKFMISLTFARRSRPAARQMVN